jgi:hypothetical protein
VAYENLFEGGGMEAGEGEMDKPPSSNQFGLVLYRLQQLEKRVSRIEVFILSGLCMIAASFMAGLFALLNLPTS